MSGGCTSDNFRVVRRATGSNSRSDTHEVRNDRCGNAVQRHRRQAIRAGHDVGNSRGPETLTDLVDALGPQGMPPICCRPDRRRRPPGEITVSNEGTPSASAQIAVGSVSTGNDDRDAHLKSAKFFDTEQHPTSTFNSTGVWPDGADGAQDGVTA